MGKEELSSITNTEDVASTPTTTLGNVSITKIDLAAEVVTIKNTGSKEVDLSGWKLVSVQGNQSYDFPADTIIQPGLSLKFFLVLMQRLQKTAWCGLRRISG